MTAVKGRQRLAGGRWAERRAAGSLCAASRTSRLFKPLSPARPRPLPRSVTLLDSFTIPCAVLLSTALLGAAYRRGHYAGAGIAVAGLLLLVVTDSSSTGSSGGSGESGGPRNPVLGDGLVLLGATMYALCNVLQEWLLGKRPHALRMARVGWLRCWSSSTSSQPATSSR